MTNDEFLETLRADWRGAPVDLERIRALTARRRRLAGLYLAAGPAGALVTTLLGIWFTVMAATNADPLFAVAAVAFFISALLLLVEFVTLRRAGNVRHDDTPRGVLLQARQQLDFSRLLVRGGQWCAAILGAAAVAALALGAGGRTATPLAYEVAAAWGSAAALTWLWQRWREGRLAVEAERCARMLAELDEADAEPAG